MQFQAGRHETDSTVEGQLTNARCDQIATPLMECHGDCQSLLRDEHGDFPETDCGHGQIVRRQFA